MKKILTYVDIVKPLAFKTHNVNLFWNVNAIITGNRNIDFDVFLPTKGFNLQRPFCWSLKQKQELILSIIKGIYIPKLAILVDQETDIYNYQIIDGKQRLNAILSFLRNEYPLTIKNKKYFFTDLDEKLQWIIKGYSPQCEVAYFSQFEPISDDAKIEWFEQINFAGTPQDIEHLKKLRK